MTTTPDGTTAPSRRSRRLTIAALATGVAVAVALPLGWYLTRPADNAGLTLSQVRAGQTVDAAPAPDPGAVAAAGDEVEPSPGGAEESTESDLPTVTVRDASLESNRAADVPDPARLRIPSLDIDAAINPVGVEPDGSMVIPREVAEVGWYRYGPEPGAENGNAVLAGHVDTIAQGPGALFPMRNIEPGALIEVTDEAGTVLRYEVQGKEAIVKTDLPTDEIFARDGAPVLVIVTCGGPYLPNSRRYSENFVVTAVPVDEP